MIKVIKGTNRFSFITLIIIGNKMDKIRIFFGKNCAILQIITKIINHIKKKMIIIILHGDTIFYDIARPLWFKFCDYLCFF